ncbi:hypothetical protein D3C80_1732810 [compost metagenome]
MTVQPAYALTAAVHSLPAVSAATRLQAVQPVFPKALDRLLPGEDILLFILKSSMLLRSLSAQHGQQGIDCSAEYASRVSIQPAQAQIQQHKQCGRPNTIEDDFKNH